MAKDTKFKLNLTEQYDFRSVEKLLEQESEQGWILTEATTYGFRFRKVEPARRRFRIVFCSQDGRWDMVPNEEVQTLIDLVESSGWKLIDRNWKMLYFMTEDETAPEPETDEGLKLEAVQASLKVSFFPAWGVLIIILGILNGVLLSEFRTEYFQVAGNLPRIMELLSLISVSLLSVCNLVGYAYWIRKAKKMIEAGGSCPEVNYVSVMNVFSIAAIVLFALLSPVAAIVCGNISKGAPTLVRFILMMTLLIAVSFLEKSQRKKGAQGAGGLIMTIVFIAVFALNMGVVSLTDQLQEYDDPSKNIALPWFTSYHGWGDEVGADGIWTYQVVEIKNTKKMETYTARFLKEKSYKGKLEMEEIDPSPWGADHAWLAKEKEGAILDMISREGMYSYSLAKNGFIVQKGNYLVYMICLQDRPVLADAPDKCIESINFTS